MKGIFAFILFLAAIFFTSCFDREPEIVNAGILDEWNRHKIEFINPDEFDSFEELVESIDQIVCAGKIPTINIQDGNIDRRIGLANPCWKNTVCILIKNRNVLKIKDELIVRSRANSINLDQLDKFISKHYSNYGKEEEFSQHPTKALVSITYENIRMTNLQSVLKEIIISFEKLKLESPLLVWLEKPLSPPRPAEINVATNSH